MIFPSTSTYNFQKATFDKLSKVQKLHVILQSFPSHVQSLSKIQTCALASLHCTMCVHSQTAKWTGYGKMLPHFRVNNVLLHTLLLPIHSYPLPLSSPLLPLSSPLLPLPHPQPQQGNPLDDLVGGEGRRLDSCGIQQDVTELSTHKRGGEESVTMATPTSLHLLMPRGNPALN